MQTETHRQQWKAAYRNARHMRNLADMLDGRWPSCDMERGKLADAASLATVRSGDRLRHRITTRKACELPWLVGRAAIDGPRGKLP